MEFKSARGGQLEVLAGACATSWWNPAPQERASLNEVLLSLEFSSNKTSHSAFKWWANLGLVEVRYLVLYTKK